MPIRLTRIGGSSPRSLTTPQTAEQRQRAAAAVTSVAASPGRIVAGGRFAICHGEGAVADLDGDGRKDVTATCLEEGKVVVLVNRGLRREFMLGGERLSGGEGFDGGDHVEGGLVVGGFFPGRGGEEVNGEEGGRLGAEFNEGIPDGGGGSVFGQ